MHCCKQCNATFYTACKVGRVKQIWYLSPMRAAKVQASLHNRTVLPEPSLLAHTSSESRGTFRQKARSLAPLNGWACAVKICHDGMLEDTNSLDGAQVISESHQLLITIMILYIRTKGVDSDQTAPERLLLQEQSDKLLALSSTSFEPTAVCLNPRFLNNRSF